MSELNKDKSSLKAKFDIARTVPMTPAFPLIPTAPVAPAPVTPRPRNPANKGHVMSLPFTYAFHDANYVKAAALTQTIDCPVEDIITLISRRFDATALDISITTIQPRKGAGKRILLKIDQAAIDRIRQMKDPLGVRSDGYLLRAPVIAALDTIANIVLLELEAQYGA